ncbi:hypothetical protein FACS1894102_7590 [Spirochaetia bacterium]|nr:hypothetical protein FACS1894102_7590 [Spirochaetia bacterium]
MYALKNDLKNTFTMILIGNNIVNNFMSSIASGFALYFGKHIPLVFVVFVLTAVIVIFGEIIPKTFAVTHHTKIILLSAPALKGIKFVLCPLTFLFSVLTGSIEKIEKIVFGKKNKTDTQTEVITENELRIVFEECSASGALSSREKMILSDIFDFSKLEISDIMIANKDVVFIEEKTPCATVREIFIKTHFSYLPVFDTQTETYVGYVFFKDLLFAGHSKTISRYIQPIKTVSANLKALNFFRSAKTQAVTPAGFAAVREKTGKHIGIITRKDILNTMLAAGGG